jgi:hypothetical protein
LICCKSTNDLLKESLLWANHNEWHEISSKSKP